MNNLTVEEDSNDESLIKIHGTFMLIAWLFFANNGIFIARHSKDTFSNRIKGTSIWFGIHQILMITTWILTMISIIIMFIGHGFEALNKDKIAENPHSLLGILAIILVFFQPLVAFFRPSKISPYRKWFNFIHSIIGLTCISLGISAIYMTNTLEAAKLDTTLKTLSQFFIGFLIICDQLMSIAKRNFLFILAKIIHMTFIVGTFTMTCIAVLFLLL